MILNITDIVRIDGIKWWITKDTNGGRLPIALCPQHDLRLTPRPETHYNSTYRKYMPNASSTARKMKCEEGPHYLEIPREYSDEKSYIIDRVDALVFKKMSVINLDDESIPVAIEDLKDKNSPYWVRAKVTESKSGIRLIIWAGDRSKKNKAQLFVEPGLKRLGFDHSDDHPTEIFTKVTATFVDDNNSTISKG